MVESLRVKLLAERRKNLLQEIQIRKEMGDAMLQQIMEAEELHRYVIVNAEATERQVTVTWTCEMFSLFFFFFKKSSDGGPKGEL